MHSARLTSTPRFSKLAHMSSGTVNMPSVKVESSSGNLTSFPWLASISSVTIDCDCDTAF